MDIKEKKEIENKEYMFKSYTIFNEKIIPIIPWIKGRISESIENPQRIIIKTEDIKKETSFEWIDDDHFYWLAKFRLLEERIWIESAMSNDGKDLLIIRMAKVSDLEHIWSGEYIRAN